MSELTDTDRIEFLERFFADSMKNNYLRISLRNSGFGRGARLHVTQDGHWEPNFKTVRDAIDYALQDNEKGESHETPD